VLKNTFELLKPEDGMWLPKGGQIENGRLRISSSRRREIAKERKKELLNVKKNFLQTIKYVGSIQL